MDNLRNMPSDPSFDAALLRRYDRPGPRYTSYPTAPQFSMDFGEQALREAVHVSNSDPIPRPLSIYVHVPFCESPCFYCGCNRIITRDKARAQTYLACLYREIAMTAALFDRARAVTPGGVNSPVRAFNAVGGTPRFIERAEGPYLVDVDGTPGVPGTARVASPEPAWASSESTWPW